MIDRPGSNCFEQGAPTIPKSKHKTYHMSTLTAHIDTYRSPKWGRPQSKYLTNMVEGRKGRQLFKSRPWRLPLQQRFRATSLIRLPSAHHEETCVKIKYVSSNQHYSQVVALKWVVPIRLPFCPGHILSGASFLALIYNVNGHFNLNLSATVVTVSAARLPYGRVLKLSSPLHIFIWTRV